jgi:uncharacterized membrane protein
MGDLTPRVDVARVLAGTALVVLVTSPALVLAAPKVDPETGKIRILHFGSSGLSSRVYPFDPMFKFALVPAYMFAMGREEVQRSLRVYMPRSDAILADNDVLVLADTDSSNYRDLWITWFRDAVLEEGLGLIMTAGGESFGGVEGYGVGWIGTPIEDLIPVQMYHQMTWDMTHLPDFSVPWEMADADHVLSTALPYDDAPVLGPQNHVAEKQGARTLALAKNVPGRNERWPVWTYDEVEEARTMAFTAHMWEKRHGLRRFDMWDYFLDHVANMVYFTCSMDIPEDLETVHRIRDSFREYGTRKVFAHSLVEFIQKFGANTRQLERRIEDADLSKAGAEELYVTQDYPASYEMIQGAISEMKSISLDSAKLKEAALLWVYITEYLAVSGTSMVTGFLLWTLMVRRRLYRDVQTTRSTTR